MTVAILTATEVMKFPPFGVMVGVATVERIAGADTVKLKGVLLVTPPPAAFTVTEKVPVGVDPVVAIFSTVEQLTVQEEGENEPVVPEGSPETLNETA